MTVDLMWWIKLFSVLLIKRSTQINGAKLTLCSPPCLLVSNTSDIVAVDYGKVKVNSAIQGLTRAVAIDVHFSLGYIFWSDVTELNIKRFRIDVKSTTTVISNIGVCDGLAVQWRTSQLYWTDTTYNKISVSDLDGNNQLTLLSSALEEPRAIALDPDSDVMIWTDWGSTPKIEKASLSGQQRVAIVTKELFYPNGIDLDRGSKRIFWVDAGYDRVESVDYNGNNRKLLFQMYGLHPFGVALIPPFLFFTDWVTYREFHMLDATTGKVLRSFNINGGQPMGIVAYDSGRQSVASGPCAVNNGGCSHFCIPKASNHECVCPTGLVVKQDGKTCEEKVKKFILFADADGKSINIVSLDVNYFVAQTLFNHRGNQRPIALDYDPVEDRVYWSDIAQGLIVSAFINATSSKILFRCNILVPDGLAIDHVARNIYWTDTGNNRIEVARLDGTGRKALIASGLDEPRAILLDERNGMMYWTDWGAAPKVEKAAMDGSVRRSIVTGNLAWPNGLTLDQTTNRLYWADAKLDTIEMSDLDGGNRQIVLSSSAGIHPYGLTIYQDILYWTDWNNRSISSYNATSGEADMVIPDLQQPMDIHVFDPSLMFLGSHSCSQNNGMCSDLCLLKPGGYQCACPTGVALKVDGKNCDHDLFQKISSEHFLLFAEADHSEIYKVSLAVTNTPCYPLQININISRPVAVDYDPVEGKIYWTDVTLKLLARAFPNGSSVEVIAHTDVETPDGLVVDYIGRILYWTDTGTSKLEVARLDGSFRKSLITTGIESPRAIILDIARRQMYWSDWGSSPKIEQANMDGSSRKTIVSTGLVWVNALALDSHSNLLYWCDANLDKIERANLQGNNRELVLDLSSYNHHPFGLSLSDDTLYWSDWSNQSIHKYNLTSSQSEVLVYGMGRPMDVHVHDLTKVLIGSTSCSQVNGGCSHLCLPNPSGHQCFCPEGVQLKPGDALTCEGVNRCQQLYAPPHGSLEPCSNLPGQTCQFSCDKGYTLTGSATRTCNSDGAWTGIPTQCNAVTCSALSEPSNGSRLGCAGTTIEYFNTVCSFFCHPGYDPIGSASRKCLENGTWSGQDFFCQVITCPTLLVPPKGVLLTSFCGNTYGSNCVFGCESGYGSLDGNITRTCLQNSVWSGDNINCTDILPPTFDVPCPASPLIAYAEREKFSAEVNWTVPTATDNSGLKAVINSNYHPPRIFRQGSYIITYSAVDQSGNKATCSFTIEVIVINCTSLVANPGSALRMSSCGNHYGARCEFSCANGYRLNGSSDVTCVTSDDRPPAVWDNLIPTCQSITCPSLPIPTNGGKKGCEDTVSELYDTLCSFYCNDGYSLVGSSVRRCLENGTWSGETSLCLIIRCSPLVPPTDISISPSSCSSISNYGQICRLTCSRPGYSPNGTLSRTCGSDGQWTGLNDTRCTDTTPPSFNNTCPKNMMVYTPECSSIALVGWTEPIADDNSGHIIATFPSIRPSAQLSIGLYHIMYSASDAEGNRANCTFVVQVTRKYCIKLQPPSHGNVSLSCGFSFGSQANFTCDRGYQLFGSGERFCKKDGSWSGHITTCNAITCSALPEPSNGSRLGCAGTTIEYFNTVCSFFCHPGYDSIGSASRKCLENGTWSGQNFFCQVITCPNLIVPPKGILLNSPCGNTYGSICVFGCESGYGSPGGNITRTCLGSSMWSGDNINCTDILPPTFDVPCPASPLISYAERGKFSAKVNWTLPTAIDNSGLKPVINSNYHPPRIFRQGTYIITYSAVDQAGNKATCSFTIKVIVINCTLLVADPGSPLRMSSCGNHYGARCEFSCASGFRLNGSSDVICVTPNDRPPAVWDNPIPTCQSITCPSLPIPTNGGKRGCEDTVSELYDTLCSFYCNDGYSLVGSSARRCLENGTWSGETSLCLLITCSPLVPPTDVSISPSSCSSISNYGQTCRLTCSRPGYSPNGTSSRTCGRDGQWTGSNDTRCTDTTPPSFNNTCPKDMMVYTPECSSSALVGWIEPIADDNSGHVIVTYPSIRTSAQFRIGLYYITYSASDAEGNRANCTFVVQVTRKSCIKLQPPSHGNLSLSCGFSFGSQASFTCDRGYQLSGSRERLCKKDGSWSRNTTTCNVVKCRAIEPPSHGTVFPNQCRSASGVHYKTKCFLSCDDTPGYRLDGETVVSCLESGSWSADSTKTICKDVQPPSIQCPPNQELPTETGQAYAIVTWEVPVPSDNSNMSLSLKGLRPPQQIYTGRDYIRYEVTDTAGLSTSCTFSIHVKDVEPPAISCPDDIFLSSGKKDNMVFFPEVTTTDNVAIYSVTPNRPNGSEFTWGEHNVTFTVTDKAGNVAVCNFKVIITDESCPDLAPPENGAKACETWLAGVSCTVHCNKGYGFVNQPEDVYFCTPGGTWMNALENGQKALHFPDCSKTFKPKEAIVNGDLHYLIDECGNESVNEVIASNFIQLFQNSVFGKAGGCNGQCTIDNVEVDCGETGKRRRRETPSVPLTVRFALKVPLPANASLVDLNQTAELLSNNLLSTLNESDLNLNISGIVIEYDTSRPPHLRLASLICGKGQVQRGTQCVNCPLGFYFNDTGCHACPADQYQDQEAQSSCMLCPPGRVTIGKIGSKRRENCQEVSSMSSTDKQDGLKSVILYSSIAAGSLVFIVSLTIMAIFCAKKHPRAKHRTTPSRDIDLGYRNPVYEVAKDNPKVNEPVYMEIDVSKLPDRNGFPLDNNTDYFALSDIHQNDYERLEFTYSEA